jgi:DNA-binding NarL/FixJ family response regulator
MRGSVCRDTASAPPAEGRIRVAIVEDHAMVAQGLCAALAIQTDLVVVGVATTLAEGRRLLAVTPVDVVLLDRRLPDGDGVAAAAALRHAAGGAAVLILTGDEGPDVVAGALAGGCAGVLRKGATIADVAQGIRDAHAGDGVFTQQMLADALRPPERGVQHLTAREHEVLQLLHAGRSTSGIADDLVLSVHTVRNHIRNLTAKLGARTRLEALARVREAGLLDGAPLVRLSG